MSILRVAYFGTPDISAEILEKLITDTALPVQVVVVVTREDKPVGRNQIITASPVKNTALKHSIPVIHSASPEEMRAYSVDLGLVFSYGKILPQTLLDATTHGFWNIHPSLLPLYRGSAPTAYPLLIGEDSSGCSLMKMDVAMDHGPIIAQDTFPISRTDTQTTLLNKLAVVGYNLFRTYVVELAEGRLHGAQLAVQNDSLATFTRMLTRDDGFLELSLIKKALAKERITTEEFPLLLRTFISQNTVTEFPIPYAPYIVYNMFRALHPWPGIWTIVEQQGSAKRLKILDVALENDSLIIKTVQLEGRQPTPFSQAVLS